MKTWGKSGKPLMKGRVASEDEGDFTSNTIIWEKFNAKFFCRWYDTMKIERMKYF